MAVTPVVLASQEAMALALPPAPLVSLTLEVAVAPAAVCLLLNHLALPKLLYLAPHVKSLLLNHTPADLT